MFTRKAIRYGLSVLLMLMFIFHTMRWFELPLVQQIENIAYDMRVRLTVPNTVDSRIVIVDIDEASLAEVGRWPWGRDTIARLINTMFDTFMVGVVGFDVVFAEPDESSGLRVLDKLGQGPLKEIPQYAQELDKLRPSLQNDRLFAEELKRGNPVVLGYYFKTDKDAPPSGALPAPIFTKEEMEQINITNIPFVEAGSFGANLPELQNNTKSGGFFENPLVDRDGVFRRVPLMQKYQGALYQSLAFSVARASLGDPPITFGIANTSDGVGVEYGMEWIGLGRTRIPVDEQAAVLVPYRGPQKSFPYVSAKDVLNGKANPETLFGALVLVGTTAPGLLDLRNTPVQSVYPGVEVHANIISGILDGRIKERPAYTFGIELVTLLFIGLVLTILLPILSPLWTTLVTTLLMVLLAWGNLYMWQKANFVLPLASPLMLILTLFFYHMSYGFFVESRGKRQIAKMFGQYIPTELVEEMNKSGKEFTIGGESREMTVLFSDVRGFTTISEGLKPDELTRLMNAFLTPMTHVIHVNRGTIDKYMGDAIMAFWGAPMEDPRHAYHGITAGLYMVKKMYELKDEFRAKGWPELKIGVGLNTGSMNVGNMGSEFRMAYTVLGDAVNLGSRLEGLTKNYGVSLLVSEYTKAKAPEFLYRELDRVRVKGKNEPVIIFEPVILASEASEELKQNLELFQKSLALYLKQDWDGAEKILKELVEREPERLVYKIYLERIEHFRMAPPGEDWDGVFTFTTK